MALHYLLQQEIKHHDDIQRVFTACGCNSLLWVMAFTLWSHRDGHYNKGQVILLLGERFRVVLSELVSEPVIQTHTQTPK